MTDEERIKEYERLCDEAHSNLEAPMLGEILTPLCASCTHIDMKYGTWDEPVCEIFGEKPIYLDCHHYDCPKYKQIEGVEDCHLPKHMRKGKQ